ncbi:unnamed protein product [Trichogramma brassicae]|uniref:Uncharacterized protein n=1 Tax=Trichogramma brassicae TaxID=86971 RepID=A0A6H5J517_9HYME|nr:unnamed protein product [Trichogramma brassicae]
MYSRRIIHKKYRLTEEGVGPNNRSIRRCWVAGAEVRPKHITLNLDSHCLWSHTNQTFAEITDLKLTTDQSMICDIYYIYEPLGTATSFTRSKEGPTKVIRKGKHVLPTWHGCASYPHSWRTAAHVVPVVRAAGLHEHVVVCGTFLATMFVVSLFLLLG